MTHTKWCRKSRPSKKSHGGNGKRCNPHLDRRFCLWNEILVAREIDLSGLMRIQLFANDQALLSSSNCCHISLAHEHRGECLPDRDTPAGMSRPMFLFRDDRECRSLANEVNGNMIDNVVSTTCTQLEGTARRYARDASPLNSKLSS